MPRLLPLSASPSSPQESSLRLPANRRIATPVSHRLKSITDPGSTAPIRVPDITKYSSPTAADAGFSAAEAAAEATPRGRSIVGQRLPLPFSRGESSSSRITQPAPPYNWVPEPIEEGLNGREPVEGEKLRQLRREDDEGKTAPWWQRKRVVLLAAVLIVTVALAVGLGVGLSRQAEGSKDAAGSGNSTAAPLEFPLGQRTVGATLVEASTACTSNPDTWRCYPDAIGGEAIFDLTIANTSALHSPNSTSRAGVPGAASAANLTISSSNPFAVPFTNQLMSYVHSPGNASSERLEWSFEMAKSVMPSSPLIENGGVAECAFPGTVFTGILYLSTLRMSAYEQVKSQEWPYAVEIRQSKHGDGAAVVCQGMAGGAVTEVPSAAGACHCVYRNY